MTFGGQTLLPIIPLQLWKYKDVLQEFSCLWTVRRGEFALGLSYWLLLRDPVKSYVSVTSWDNTANLETKQISFRKKNSNMGKRGNRECAYPTKSMKEGLNWTLNCTSDAACVMSSWLNNIHWVTWYILLILKPSHTTLRFIQYHLLLGPWCQMLPLHSSDIKWQHKHTRGLTKWTFLDWCRIKPISRMDEAWLTYHF